MIKNIKRKFLLITFSSILLVVGIIVGYINIHNYQDTISKHNRVIDIVISSDGEIANSSEFEKIIFRNIIIIKVVDGVPELQQGKLSEDYTTATLYELINNTNQQKGKIKTFIFSNKMIDETKLVVISNYEIDKQLMSYFTLNSIVVSLIGIIISYVLIFFSSSYILKPFIKNEISQKEFITNASHELKTPITIIKANLDVLKIENISNEWTNSIDDQAQRLEILTNNLINLTKVEETSSKISKTIFSLTDAISEEVNNYNTSFKEKNITFKNLINANITYNGNESQIRDILKLLFDNIVKYAVPGESLVYIENKELFFTNKTNLPDGNYDSIFGRFTRIDESRNQSSFGFGIGLSIVKKVIENHNSYISANVLCNVFIIKIKL